MATVQTFSSPKELEDYLNSITLPIVWEVLGKRGKFTFVSPEDVIAGVNTLTLQIANDEAELKELIDSTGTSNATLLSVISWGYKYVVLLDLAFATPVIATVNLYTSPKALADATGLQVFAGLYDNTAQAEENDVILTYGATYTLIKEVPSNLEILMKGGFYVVINKA